MSRLVSLVVPVFNEEESIRLFLDAVEKVLADEPYAFEFVFVNDGSRDRTLNELVAARETDERVKIVDLSRNFGKEHALAAGFQAARGEAVIPMDVDMQDPPEVVKDFLRQWEAGFEVVIGVRRQRESDTPFKRRSAGLFYKAFNAVCGCHMVPNAGDYRLMSRRAVAALNALPERVRFTKGLYAWVGFPQALVYYDRPPRAAGTTKWNAWKLWNFALDGITSFSTLPLRIWSYVGMTVAVMGFVYAAWLVIRTLIFGVDMPGYASLMVTLLALGGLILVSLGVIGEYLGRIFEEVKGRPMYVVRARHGLDGEDEDDGASPTDTEKACCGAGEAKSPVCGGLAERCPVCQTPLRRARHGRGSQA